MRLARHTPAVILLLAFACGNATAETKPAAAPEKGVKMAKTETVVFVEDLHCKSCAKKIAGKLYAVKSVAKVRTHVEKNYAIVTPQKGKELDAAKLWKASQKAGFQPTRLVGPTGVYLPDPKTKAPVKEPPKKAEAA